MTKLADGAWVDKKRSTIITRTPGGGRNFQRRSEKGWKSYPSPPKRKKS
jgi:hypothetical protein